MLGCDTLAKCGVHFEAPSPNDFKAMSLGKPLEMANLKLMVTNRDEKTNYLVGALLELSNGSASKTFEVRQQWPVKTVDIDFPILRITGVYSSQGLYEIRFYG